MASRAVVSTRPGKSAAAPGHAAGANTSAERVPAMSPGQRDGRALNHLKSGVFSQMPLLPGEDAEQRDQLVRQYFDHFQPRSRVVEDAVHEFVGLIWRRTRLDRARATIEHHADQQAANDLPEPVKNLAAEINGMEIEAQVMAKLLNSVDLAVKKGETPREVVRMLALVLDRLLGWPDPVATLDPARVVLDGRRALSAQARAVEASRSVLRMAVEVARPANDVHRAMAWLEARGQAARLLQERTTLNRAIEHQLGVIHDLAGEPPSDGPVVVAATQINFHGSNSGAVTTPSTGTAA